MVIIFNDSVDRVFIRWLGKAFLQGSPPELSNNF